MKRRPQKKFIMSDINITPFTDVVLVLLIIFIVATPLLYQGKVKINLPQTKNAQTDEKPQKVTVLVNEQGDAFIDDIKYSMPADQEKLKSVIANAIGSNPEMTIVINGDRNSKYDYVVQVIDIVKGQGVKKVMLSTQKK